MGPAENTTGIRAFRIIDLSADDTDAIDQVVALIMAAFPNWKTTLGEARGEVRESFEPGRISLVARAEDDILGWIGAIPTYDCAWELHPLLVRADNRGLGIGKALVAALEDRLRGLGALTVYLGTDDDGETAGTSAWGIDLFPDLLTHVAHLEVIYLTRRGSIANWDAP